MCSENSLHKNATEWRNFYGRFKGKSLSATQTKALHTDFEKYSIQNIEKISDSLNFKKLDVYIVNKDLSSPYKIDSELVEINILGTLGK